MKNRLKCKNRNNKKKNILEKKTDLQVIFKIDIFCFKLYLN